MINPVPFATALAAIAAVCYVLGELLALAAPGAFVTLAVGSWRFGWALAAMYNALSTSQQVRRCGRHRKCDRPS